MKKNKPEHTDQLHAEEARWFALYTSFRREKVVDRMLSQKGIISYLPLQKITRRYGRKVRSIEMPLMSCYIFVKITRSEYISVLETEHVIKFIRFSKDLLAIPENQIEIIRQVTGAGVPIDIESTLYKKGDMVEVISGSLAGIKGRLISIEGKKQLTVELIELGCSLRMAIDISLVRKINTPVAS